jgi:hypothetical protein
MKYRPKLEALEDRLVPATCNWIGNVSPYWDNDANWSGGAKPTEFDTAAFGASAQQSCLVDSGVNAVCLQLTSSSSFNNYALKVAGTLKVGPALIDSAFISRWGGGDLSIDAAGAVVIQNVEMDWVGGNIGKNVTGGSPGTIYFNGGTTNAVQNTWFNIFSSSAPSSPGTLGANVALGGFTTLGVARCTIGSLDTDITIANGANIDINGISKLVFNQGAGTQPAPGAGAKGGIAYADNAPISRIRNYSQAVLTIAPTTTGTDYLDIDPEIVNYGTASLGSNSFVALNENSGGSGQTVDFYNTATTSILDLQGGATLECDHGDFMQTGGFVDQFSGAGTSATKISAPQNTIDFEGGELRANYGVFNLSADAIKFDGGATMKVWVWNAGGWGAGQLNMNSRTLTLGTCSIRVESNISAAPPAGTSFQIYTETVSGSYTGSATTGQDTLGTNNYTWNWTWNPTTLVYSIS